MHVTETLSEGLSRELTVVISAKEIEDKVNERLKEMAGNVRIPGFRPGKAPLPMLKQRYGDSVMGEVIEKTVQESSAAALSEKDLRPAMQPKIEITAFEKDKDLEYKMSLEIMPAITPADFKTLKVERPVADIEDSHVEDALGRLEERARKPVVVEEDRPAVEGDVLRIDFVGKLDGEAFEGGTAENYDLELGSGSFIPGFEEQLIGAAKGEEKLVNVTFPEDYGAAHLAGKAVTFDVTVHELLTRQEMPLDDSLAEALGFETIDELRKSVREQMDKEHGAASRQKMKRKMLDLLAESHDFELPKGLVDAEFEAIWSQLQKELEAAGGDSEAPDEETMKAEYRTIAERRVRLGLLLAEVGRLNNISVTEEEVQRAMFDAMRNYPGQEKAVLEYFQNNPEAQASLRAPIYEDKVIDFIAELAEIEDYKVSVEALFREDESEGESEEKAEA